MGQVDAGRAHTCPIGADGRVACLGDNYYSGQASVPGDLGSVTQVSVGDRHTCAVKSDGTVACWGRNRDRQANVPGGLGTVTRLLGDYPLWTNMPAKTSVPANLGRVTRLQAWRNRTCVVMIDGTIECWGDVVSTTFVE
jgi:alpha-tubulin suppressor-like RCC1 family protein